MRKHGRRILSVLLASLMILTSMPSAVFGAAENSGFLVQEELTEPEEPADSPAGQSSDGEQEPEGQETTDLSDPSETDSSANTLAETNQWQSLEVALSVAYGEGLQMEEHVIVEPLLAQTYGFTYGDSISAEEGHYTLLDALVLSQTLQFEDVTKENIRDYIDVDETGKLTKLNGVPVQSGEDTYILLNGMYVEEWVEFGYYDSANPGSFEIYDGDEITIVFSNARLGPVLSDGSITDRTENSAVLNFTSNAAGTGYYVIQDAQAEAPESMDRGSAASFEVKAGTNQVTLSDLSADALTVYVAVEDENGVMSDILSVSIEALEALSGITLNRTSLTMGEGQEVTLTAATTPTGYEDEVVWSSSNEKAAAAADGVVTAGEAGEAVITASIGEYSASCQVEVIAKPTLETTLTDGTEIKSSRRTFDVFARDADGNKISSSVQMDGSSVAYNWDDSTKTSYTLNFSGKKEGAHTVVVSATDSLGQTVSQEYTIYYVKAEKGELIGYATFDIEATTINCGYLIEPVKVPIYEGENAAEALVRLLEENGYDYSITGSVKESFYLSSIIGSNAARPGNATTELNLENASLNEDLLDLGIAWREGSVGQLGEFDYASGSGWMYCLNNVFPNVGFADSYLADGDVVRVQFTVALGSDIGGGGSTGGGSAGKIRAEKDDLASAIALANSAQNKETLLANAAIQAAYEKANEVMLDLPAAQEEVDAACEALETALQGEQPASMKLKEETLTLENMVSHRLEVIYEPENITVPMHITWTSSDSKVASVAADGTVTAKNAGTAQVTASCGEWSGTCVVTVPEIPMTGISIPEEITLIRADTADLAVEYAPVNTTDPRDVTWTVEDPSIAVVTGTELLGVAPGTTKVTAAVGEFTASCQVTVKEIPITGIETGDTNLVIQPGKTQTLSYQVLPSDTTEDVAPSAISTDTGVATVTVSSSRVTVKGVSYGEADVILKVGNKSASYHVTVKDINATNFEFRTQPESILKGKTTSVYLDYEPVTSPSNAGDIQWSTSDDSVISIYRSTSTYVTLKGEAAGKATITATLGEISRSMEVEVQEVPLEGITLEADEVEAYVGQYTSVRATIQPSNTTDDTKITWESSDPDVLSVTSTSTYGSFTPKKAGTVTLTAKLGSFSASCVVNVKERPEVESIALDTAKLELGVGKSQSLGIVVTPSDATYSSTKAKWTSSNPSVATVGTTGSVKGIAPGETVITATYDGRLTASATVTVVDYPVEDVIFTDESAEIKGIGSSKSLKLTITPSNYTETLEVSAVSSDEGVVKIKSASKSYISVEAVAAGTAEITATVTAPSGTYTAKIPVTVDPNYVTGFAFKRASYEIQKGKSLTMTSVSYADYLPSGSNTKSLTWASDNTEVATVDANGNVTAVNYGEANITVTTHDGASATCKIVVPNAVTDLTISASKLGMLKGSSIKLDAIDFQPEGADMRKFSWASNNTDVIIVDGDLIKAVGEGTAAVYGTAGSAIAACEITVTLSEEEAAAISVMGLIDQIGEVTLDSEKAIQAAREAYDALNRVEKSYVTNDTDLFAAEEKLENLKSVMNEKTPLVSLEAVDYNSLKLTWEAVKGAEGYRVYRKMPGGHFTAIANVGELTTSYLDVGLATGKTYIYTVRALYTIGGKTQLGPYETAGLKAAAALPKAEITSVKSWGYCNLKVAWEQVTGADGYRLYCQEKAGEAWKYVTQINDGSETSYIHSGVTTGQSCTYYVRAYKNVDGTKVYGAYSDGVSGKAVPKQVVVNSVEKVSDTSLKISWNKVNGASGYRIYRVDEETGEWTYVTQIGSGSTTSYTEKGLKKNTSYQYRIRAYRTVNGEKIFGAYSALAKGSTK